MNCWWTVFDADNTQQRNEKPRKETIFNRITQLKDCPIKKSFMIVTSVDPFAQLEKPESFEEYHHLIL